MAETVKRILTKEKIDRQLAGQSSSTPFMHVKDNYNKRVSFDTGDRLEDKIDKLTAMMGKLAARDSDITRPFKPQIYQSKRRGQSRNFYDTHNCDRGNYINRYRPDSNDRRNQYAQNRSRPKYEQNYRRENIRGHLRSYQHPRRQNSREYRGNYRNKNYSRDRDRSRSGSKGSTHRDQIRCYKCREYDHFTKHCPILKEEREIEQIQQLFNLDKEQTSLKTLTRDTYDSLNKINSIENIRQEHLNL